MAMAPFWKFIVIDQGLPDKVGGVLLLMKFFWVSKKKQKKILYNSIVPANYQV